MKVHYYLPIAVLAAAANLSAQGWSVQVADNTLPQIQQVMDTARVEPALCLGIDLDHTSHTALVWSAVPATILNSRQTREMVQFSCPAGTAPAHGHFLARGHVDGPSDVDLQQVPRKTTIPSVVIVADRDRTIHLVLYGTR